MYGGLGGYGGYGGYEGYGGYGNYYGNKQLYGKISESIINYISNVHAPLLGYNEFPYGYGSGYLNNPYGGYGFYG